LLRLSPTIWLDRNLGAKQVATSSTDTDAYGAYYQFGAAKCPVGFGVPTEAELKAETTEAIFLVLVTVIHAKCLILNTTNAKSNMNTRIIELRYQYLFKSYAVWINLACKYRAF
jgi:hypothetical protein